MTKNKIRRMNPEDVRVLGKDVDNIILGSESAIDALYEEYLQAQRELGVFEDIKYNLERNDQTIPKELRVNIRKTKSRLRELDRRVVNYGDLMLRRIRERLNTIQSSPGATMVGGRIRSLERGLFRLERKLSEKGTDPRRDITRLMSELVTLEQDSGIWLTPPVKKKASAAGRREGESEIYAGLVKEWEKVFKHAKKHPRVRDDARIQDDIDWVNAQLRSLNMKFNRGESIRLGMERVARKIKDIHNITKPRAKLKDFDSARQGLVDFSSTIREYARGEVTPAGIDQFQYNLEKFSRQFSPKTKAEWTKDEQREFSHDLRKLRKVLDKLRRRRKKSPKENPCIGLHFHGKDADDLLEALEKSAGRPGVAEIKKNPKGKSSKKKTAKRPKLPHTGTLPKSAMPMFKKVFYESYNYYKKDRKATEKQAQEIAARTAWDETDRYYEKNETTGKWKRRKVALPQVDREHDIQLKNPKKRTSKSTSKSATPEWKRLINRCQKLWDQYLDHPSEKALHAVFANLEKMKSSKSERVKKERARCLRVANKEAKQLGMRM